MFGLLQHMYDGRASCQARGRRGKALIRCELVGPRVTLPKNTGLRREPGKALGMAPVFS
jgi:hypothetical protein